jgi:hypothetical protein
LTPLSLPGHAVHDGNLVGFWGPRESISILSPDGLPDYQAIIQPAQDFADKYSDGCVSPQILAPFCYRSAQYERAASAKLSTPSNQIVNPDVLIFFAMALGKTGDMAAAKLKLTEVEATGWKRSNVWQRQRIQLLLAEAEELISKNMARVPMAPPERGDY